MQVMILVVNWVGTLAFAIAGALTAVKKRFDLVGIIIVAVVTAVGGGAIRDVVVGTLPPTIFRNEALITVIVLSAVLVFALHRFFSRLDALLYLLDTIGLALFAVLGAERGLDAGLGLWGVMFTGTVSGVGGGMLRDIISGEIPVILYRSGDLYASAAAAGSLVVYLLYGLDTVVALLVGMAITLILRLGGHELNYHLPRA